MKTSIQSVGKPGLTYLLGILLVCSAASCTKDFEKFDSNPTALTPAQTIAILPTAFGPLEQNIYSNYQTAQNLSADAYSGYMMSPDPFSGGNNNLSYHMVDGWNQNGFNDMYKLIMAPVQKIAAAGTKAKAPELWAVLLLIQAEAMDRVTDRFGPIPYTKVGSSLTSVPYDTQQVVYQQFFNQLDTASASLQAYISANPGKTSLGTADLIYSGNFSEWLKFANSLRLRLAMRLVKVDPATAQKQAELAMAAPGGLLSTPADDAAIAQSGGRNNDVWTVTQAYDDNRLGAALATYLTGFNDPRLPVYATPATDPMFAGQYIGIRVGISIAARSDYDTYASVNTNTLFQQTSPQLIMTASEMYFLKAEAALRGWAGAGDAQTDYEAGINNSMAQFGVSTGTYLTNKLINSTEAAYTDPKNAANNSPALSTITVPWNNSASNEVKLERIITQKWIAIFPDGQEAWADYRRTGYPRLMTVINNLSNGTIDTQVQIRRLPYPTNEYNTNGTAVTAALALLGGPDNGGTRLYWDVNKGNF